MTKVYILHFDDGSGLTRAFDLILSSPDVESCVVDAEAERVRFLAPDASAEKLIERIYQDGGLTWCSRHGLEGG